MRKQEHLTEDQIAIYAEALSVGSESSIPEEWRRHVAECDQCAREVTFVSQLIDKDRSFSYESSKITKGGFLSRKLYIRIAVAASILLIVGAGIFFTIVPGNVFKKNLTNLEQQPVKMDSTVVKNGNDRKIPKKEPEKKHISTDTTKAKKQIDIKTNPRPQKMPAKRDKLAYSPNEQLEKLVDRFRDASMRGHIISVKTPSELNISKTEDLKIQISNPDERKLILEFYNNKGEKLFEKETSRETYQVKKLTEPGLYYWKLLNQDFDLLYCGKIVIKEREN